MERTGMTFKNRRHDTIKVRDLVTGYRNRKDVSVVTGGFDATLHSGELTCLLGPNGAGKSTLLRTLSAFQPPLEGEIIIEGKNISEYTDTELSKVIGVVLTERVSVSNMTVCELVGLGRSPYTGFFGSLSRKDEEIVESALRMVGIGDLRERAVHTLSDGERQKVMVAKALAQETPVIFLDEPTAFLDYPSKVEIMQLLHRLSREEGKTVFMSTHDLELALQIADKLWLVDKRLGVSVGTPEDLSLNGDMARYFEREGVEFDSVNGLFRIKSTPGREIIVSGSGARYNMLRKALLRNGIRALGDDTLDAVPDASSLPRIDILADGYNVGGRILTTIEEVLDSVV